jgi:hypothetical protein
MVETVLSFPFVQKDQTSQTFIGFIHEAILIVVVFPKLAFIVNACRFDGGE